jgi:hypothetical protein
MHAWNLYEQPLNSLKQSQTTEIAGRDKALEAEFKKQGSELIAFRFHWVRQEASASVSCETLSSVQHVKGCATGRRI